MIAITENDDAFFWGEEEWVEIPGDYPAIDLTHVPFVGGEWQISEYINTKRET
jgi:hypothetical protein